MGPNDTHTCIYVYTILNYFGFQREERKTNPLGPKKIWVPKVT